MLVKWISGVSMLSISAKSKYALIAMYELTMRYKSGRIQIRQIAAEHDIPQGYLEQLLVELKRADLVISYRGQNGGYTLSKHPSLIKIKDILVSLEGPVNLSSGKPARDVLAFFWNDVEFKLDAIFDLSLEQLANDAQKRKEVITYHI